MGKACSKTHLLELLVDLQDASDSNVPRNQYLPATIDLFCTIIYVKTVSKSEMREEAECDEDDSTPEGLYAGDQETVYIGSWLRRKRKREVLMHELAHACLDWRDEGKCES